jgi:inhibitor of KinA sporulation pathway (predicted exonuclease)
MAAKTDKIIVIDVEATCWMGVPPEGQRKEIIEIGVVVINVEKESVETSESILVRPKKSKVSSFCTKLTTLTQEQVETGISFSKACLRLRNEYFSRQYPWASWGDYDRRIFISQCIEDEVKYPFSTTHINAKDLFSLFFKLKKELGMAQSLDYLSLPIEGTHHRAEDDARNIARLLTCSLWRRK